jgi:hypothetical protein
MTSTDPSRFDDPWRVIRELRQDVRELRQLELALDRIGALEAEHEADIKREEWELREAAERDREPVYGPPDAPPQACTRGSGTCTTSHCPRPGAAGPVLPEDLRP